MNMGTQLHSSPILTVNTMSKIRIVFIGNLITLPYSPDHAGILQTFEEFKEIGVIEDYQIVDCHQVHSLGLDIIEIIRPFKPTLVINGMTDSMSNGWIIEIGKAFPDIIQVQSMWDFRPTNLNYDGLWDKWRESGPYLDLITLSNREQLDWWAKDFDVETMYWPHGCVVQDTEFDKNYNVDCVFVGDRHATPPYDERVKFIDSIDEILKENGTSITWINKPGGDAGVERAQIWKDLGKIYYSAKTVLDISHFWDSNGYASGRYFYSSGLGGCSISKRFPGCEDLFPEGTKAYFGTPEEAAFKIKYYVENKKERDEIKKSGKEWANLHHNYTKRFLELFHKLNIKI